MSHRVTVQTEIKEKEHALSALKSQKIEYREQGDTIHLLSGDYSGSSINLKSGMITSGDTDYHRVDAGKLGLLRQAYAEAKFKAEAFKQGIEISDRTLNRDGEIVLRCRTA
jgi:hypothetical protein